MELGKSQNLTKLFPALCSSPTNAQPAHLLVTIILVRSLVQSCEPLSRQQLVAVPSFIISSALITLFASPRYNPSSNSFLRFEHFSTFSQQFILLQTYSSSFAPLFILFIHLFYFPPPIIFNPSIANNGERARCSSRTTRTPMA